MSPDAPADLFGKALVKFRLVGALRRLPHALIEPVSVVTDEDAPAAGLDAVEDNLGGLSRRSRRFVAERARAIERDLLNILVRHRRGVDADAFQPLPCRQDFVLTQAIRLGAILDLAGIRDDRGADMTGHYHGTFEVRRV